MASLRTCPGSGGYPAERVILDTVPRDGTERYLPVVRALDAARFLPATAARIGDVVATKRRTPIGIVST